MAADDQEKTEEPTPKKIEDARKEGNVPKSQDISGLFTLFVASLTLLALIGIFRDDFFQFFQHIFLLNHEDINRENILQIAFETFKVFLLTAVIFAVPVAIAGVLGAVAQFGFIFTTKPLIPDLKKLDPIKGLGNLFSLKKAIEGLKITLKSMVTLAVGFWLFFQFIQELPTVSLFPLFQQMGWLAEKVVIIAFTMIFVTFVFAIADLLIVRKQYFDKLKMSKQEVKDEYKNLEGDPMIKQKIRQIQMEMSQKRMMSDIPTADVVVTNPTHYSIALRYDKSKDHVPRVVAKGVDHLAFKIREVANKHNIRIVENVALARGLYKVVEVDEFIPDEFFQTVAELLAYVYREDKKNRN
ncbi:Flagellar biosynthesis protein FlhB [Thiovulum sp. ES]|nr:Flagellar biosynthesis protein FlhB [Thiovulum sp. ES]